jgi:hypothetical protein
MGWAELQEGRWEAARVLFKEAVIAEATPEAFEGLSWTAWWLDDPAEVFEAREHAYRLYKDADDGVGAARMAISVPDPPSVHRRVQLCAYSRTPRSCRNLDPILVTPIFDLRAPS